MLTAYTAEIADAQARRYVGDDLSVKWYETKQMKKIFDSLNNLIQFLYQLKPPAREIFFNQYEKKYSAPLDVKNISFWEEVFEIKHY